MLLLAGGEPDGGTRVSSRHTVADEFRYWSDNAVSPACRSVGWAPSCAERVPVCRRAGLSLPQSLPAEPVSFRYFRRHSQERRRLLTGLRQSSSKWEVERDSASAAKATIAPFASRVGDNPIKDAHEAKPMTSPRWVVANE